VRGNAQKTASGKDGFPRPGEIAVLKVAKTAVNDFQAVGGSGVTEISLFDQGDRPPLQGCLPEQGGPMNPAADDQQVEGVVGQFGGRPFHPLFSSNP
jgi:hypothetical protein